MKKLLALILLSSSAVLLTGCAKPTPVVEEIPAPITQEITQAPESPTTINTDLQTYKNDKYGFEFQYPIENEPGNKFKIIEAENNPDITWRPMSTVVLLWCDYCQSYEMIVQAWDSQEQFQKECNGYCSPSASYQAWNKYIVVINNNENEIVNKIIWTFKIKN